jgi:ABC-type transport system involved in multi-copper enzyme maturation permease subunit
MFFQIVRKEILLNLVSFRFVVSMALLAVLVVGSLQIMASNFVRRMDDFQSSEQIHRDDMDTMNNIMQFMAFGIAKDPKPQMLGIFSIGLEQKMSSSFRVPGFIITSGGQRPDVENPLAYQEFSSMEGLEMEGSKYANPIFSLFQPPDFVYVVNIVLSLLAILFAYDCISGEKEDQTLKLMLSNAVPRDVVLLGKWVGGTLSIVVPFIMSFLLGILMVSVFWQGDLQFTEDALTRIVLILGVSTLYVMVFFLMGMAFSTFTERSTTSLIMSLFAWVFFVLVVPNIAPVIARQLMPNLSPNIISSNLETANRELNEDTKKELNKEGADREKIMDAHKKELERQVKNMEEVWENKNENQANLARNISRISPSANYVYAATNVSGTGAYDFLDFRREVPEYKKQLREKNKKLKKEGKGDGLYEMDKEKIFPPIFIKVYSEEVPQFEYTRISLADSVKNSAVDIGILAVWLIALFMASFIGFMHYDVK